MSENPQITSSSWITRITGSASRNPARVYLDRLSPGSRRTISHALRVVAGIVMGVKTSNHIQIEAFRWDKLDRGHTQKIRRYLVNRYAPATANKMLSALRGILRTVRMLGLITESRFQATAKLNGVWQLDADPPNKLTANDVKELFVACAENRTAAGRRDAALLATLLSSGLRRSEAVALDLSDYSTRAGRLHIRSERENRDRFVVFSAPAKAAMAHWLAVRGTKKGPLLLPVDKSGVIRFRRLTDQAIYDMIRRLASRSGVPHVTTRRLRRAFVVGMIAAGFDLEEVRKAVGHASWVTTAAYRILVNEKKRIDVALLEIPYVPPRNHRRTRGRPEANEIRTRH